MALTIPEPSPEQSEQREQRAETGVLVGVIRETTTDERRVALVPEVLGKLTTLGAGALVEHGAGADANFSDDSYRDAGAELASHDDVLARAGVVVCLGSPSDDDVRQLKAGQVLVGLLRPWERPEQAQLWAERGVSAIALDYLPRTLSRAQVMDALTSQASVAGYRSAVVAAHAFGGFFPMLMTAAGTVKPAQVLVLGAGVAGLQAIATARRLGASVSGYDVRPAARAEVASLGAKFVDLPGVVSTSESDGYARELNADERAAQLAALDKHISRADVVITTAQVPGRKPPMLVKAAAVADMKPGSVIVDMAASSYGGNVEVSQTNSVVVVDPGVTVIGAGNLASEMAPAASTAYARNIVAFLGQIVKDGAVTIDPDDDVVGAMLVTHDGQIIHPAVRDAVAAVIEGDTV